MLNPSLQSLADVLVTIVARQLVNQRLMESEVENCRDSNDLNIPPELAEGGRREAVARHLAQAETVEVQL